MLEELNIKPGLYKVNVSIRQGSILLDHIVGVNNFVIAESDFYGAGRFKMGDMALCLKKHKWMIK